MEKCCTKNQNYFAAEVEKVQAKRKDLMDMAIKQKKQQKENIQPYLEKKAIIPTTLQTNSPSLSISRFSAFKHHSYHNSHHQQSNYQSLYSQKNVKIIGSMLERKISINNNSYKNQQPIQNTLTEKWKLQMNSEQKNGLIFGKELKIGAEVRKKYLTDQQIKKIQESLGFRNKPKHFSVHYYRSTKIKKKEKYIKIQGLAPSCKYRKQVQDLYRLPSSFNITETRRPSIGKQFDKKIKKILKVDNFVQSQISNQRKKFKKAKSQINFSVFTHKLLCSQQI